MTPLALALWIGSSSAFYSAHLAAAKSFVGRAGILLAVSEADKDRLLLTEPALNAFIVAEMRDFLSKALEQNDKPSGKFTRWIMTDDEKIAAMLLDKNGIIIDDEYEQARRNMTGEISIDLLCNTTQLAFRDAFVNQPGLFSALGSAICFFRDSFRTPVNFAACERIGISDYTVAHHITDMYHHRNFRGAYTKTLAPSGKGEIAARIAVGLQTHVEEDVDCNDNNDEDDVVFDGIDDDDECLLWSPTTPGVCIHWKSEDEAWRKKRFERIQMEGTRDPRRGGSGTTR